MSFNTDPGEIQHSEAFYHEICTLCYAYKQLMKMKTFADCRL